MEYQPYQPLPTAHSAPVFSRKLSLLAGLFGLALLSSVRTLFASARDHSNMSMNMDKQGTGGSSSKVEPGAPVGFVAAKAASEQGHGAGTVPGGRTGLGVLCVGSAGVDVINIVPHYPAEDSQVRTTRQIVSRGGNAGNSLAVLSQLGSYRLSFLGSLGAKSNSHVPILDDFERHGVDSSLSPLHAEHVSGTSYITSASDTGSRTIIVHRGGLPELSVRDWQAVPRARVASQALVHFEGRKVPVVKHMMASVRPAGPAAAAPSGPVVEPLVSLEIERARPPDEVLELVRYADVVFLSREFVLSQQPKPADKQASAGSVETPEGFLRSVHKSWARPGTLLVCGWGSRGAYALWEDTLLFSAAKSIPGGVQDSIGAGDSFNAGFLHTLLALTHPPNRQASGSGHKGVSWPVSRAVAQKALDSGCRVAERKLGRFGFELGLDSSEGKQFQSALTTMPRPSSL